MDNHNMLKAFIVQFSGQENTIAINTAYCKFVGRDLSIGAFLSQCIYWSDKSSRKDGFFYKPRHEWEEEIFLSDYTIRKATKLLTEMEILETKLIKANGSPTLHYRVKMETFLEKFGAFLIEEKKKMEENNAQTVENTGFVEFNKWNRWNQQMDSLNSTNGFVDINDSLTETTTKTTTKKKRTSVKPPSSVPYVEITDHYNKVSGRRLQYETYRKNIESRWKGGNYTLEDFKNVIDDKYKEWVVDTLEPEKTNSWFHPDTLFRNDKKFSKYVMVSREKREKVTVQGNNKLKDWLENEED